MNIPSLLYGRPAAVRSRCRKAAKNLVKTGPSAFDPGPFVDTRNVEGLILVEEEMIVSAGEHFHCDSLSMAIFGLLRQDALFAFMDEWIRWSILEPWRFLGVVSQVTGVFLGRNSSLWQPFVEAAARFWPVFTSEGNRFGPFVNEPTGPWPVMRNVRYAAGRLGVPKENILQYPAEGPAAFLDHIPEPGDHE